MPLNKPKMVLGLEDYDKPWNCEQIGQKYWLEKNFKTVLEGRVTCRLHRKSPKEYNKNPY